MRRMRTGMGKPLLSRREMLRVSELLFSSFPFCTSSLFEFEKFSFLFFFFLFFHILGSLSHVLSFHAQVLFYFIFCCGIFCLHAVFFVFFWVQSRAL